MSLKVKGVYGIWCKGKYGVLETSFFGIPIKVRFLPNLSFLLEVKLLFGEWRSSIDIVFLMN
jgi:hypothetical protein